MPEFLKNKKFCKEKKNPSQDFTCSYAGCAAVDCKTQGKLKAFAIPHIEQFYVIL